MQFIWQPLFNLLIIFYHLFGNLGLAVVAFTAFTRLLLTPLTLPSMRMMQVMRELAPELERLKKRHAGDKQKLMQAQADFYKEKGVNPASGCLPQIVQVVILIALFSGFTNIFQINGNITERLNDVLYPPLRVSGEINKVFLGKDLTQPDELFLPGIPFSLPGVFLIAVALIQFLSSKMMTPQLTAAERVAKKTEGGFDDLASSMQGQMLYMFPILTIFAGHVYKFPLGVVIYWGAFSLFQSVQQYFISGWGGLYPTVRLIRRSLGLPQKS